VTRRGAEPEALAERPAELPGLVPIHRAAARVRATVGDVYWPEGFQRFYSAYPRHKNRGDAKKAWTKLRPSPALLELMFEAIEVWKRAPDWIKDGGQFIPYPASWLNAEGWLDEEIVVPVLSQRTLTNMAAAEEFVRLMREREKGPGR